MLVLSRQRDESIMIGDTIVVTIVDIRGDKVRLGINAPSEIPVHRQEVYEAIQRENMRASRLDPADTQDIGKFTDVARTNGQQNAPEGPGHS
jgi:carbon storage regulator